MTHADPPAESQPSRSRCRPAIAWSFNIALLTATCVWILCDGSYYTFVHTLPRSRKLLLWILWTGTVFISINSVLLSILRGPSRYRSLKAWLGFTALASAWCALVFSHDSFHWLGQKIRSRGDISAYEPIVAELRSSWPNQDGNLQTIRNFTAYPIGAPRTLRIVGTTKVPDAAPIAGIDRSDKGAIRLELVLSAPGVWIEWHPDGSVPESFTGGTETQYDLLRATQLRRGWYLAQYREHY